ncbi:hypothetical protein ACIGO9_28925 [Nocardia asteroides]|uniref:hypothetical protein n=1 Tax=Nocardia asteroides TaxID=1824 RepID=UPI0037C62D04
MTPLTKLAGRPINGEISHYGSAPIDQRPIEELIALLDAVLALPNVKALRWEQYTPYFNDGDACEFSINESSIWVSDPRAAQTDSESPADEDGDEDDDEETNFLDLWSVNYNNDPNPRSHGREDGWAPSYPYIGAEITEAWGAFNRALESGAFDNDLHLHFGDPAQVTATTAGFDVESYDHD